MDSFKIYLPSNASADFFPNNTPTDYQTHLVDPIQLDGDWEAGLESIFYSNKIGNEKETVYLEFSVKTKKKFYITDLYPFKFNVTKDWTWPSFDLYPKEIVTDPSDLKGVLNCLNSVNKQIVQNEGLLELFSFQKRGSDDVWFQGATNGALVVISYTMSRYLGFGWNRTFGSYTPTIATKKRVIPKALTRGDYLMQVLDTNVLQKITRVTIKRAGFDYPKSTKMLTEAWNGKMFKPYKNRIEFDKSGKLILHNHDSNIVIKPSPDFCRAFEMSKVIPGRAEEWALLPFKNNETYHDDFWYIDLYSRYIDYTIKNEYHTFSYEFTPRMFDSVSYIIPMINRLTREKLKSELDSLYDAKAHLCDLTLFKNHTKLTVGKWIELRITPNLAFILGFDETIFKKGRYVSKRLPATLEQREQHIFVLSNLIQSISYGGRKVDVLQEFIHEADEHTKRIIEKRFHPISYNPVKRSYIENLQIQVVNELFEPVFIKDSKTVVIIHFRKRK